jgi:hypothetical protein
MAINSENVLVKNNDGTAKNKLIIVGGAKFLPDNSPENSDSSQSGSDSNQSGSDASGTTAAIDNTSNNVYSSYLNLEC